MELPPEPFDLPTYTQAVTRSFDIARTCYNVLVLTCGLMFLFLVRAPAFRGTGSSLEYVNERKAAYERLEGEAQGLIELQQSDPTARGAIAEVRRDQSRILADMYCAVTTPDSRECVNLTTQRLAKRNLDPDDVRKVIEDRQKEMMVVGTGFRVPLLNEVIEPTHVPLISTIVVCLTMLVLRAATANWLSSVQWYLAEARRAARLRSAYHLTAMSALSIPAPGGQRGSEWLWITFVVGLHFVPATLIGTMIWRHRYIFQPDLPIGDPSLALDLVFGYGFGFALIAAASAMVAADVVRMRAELRRVAEELAASTTRRAARRATLDDHG
jgi:hypothetical protein